MKKNLKNVVVFIFALFLVAGVFAQQKINLKIGSVSPDNSPWSVEQKKMAQEWAKITNGEVTITFMNATALGGENGVIQKMKVARPGMKAPLDGGIFTNIGIYELAPESHVLTLCMPFMFKDQSEIDYVIKNTENHINKAIEDQGFYLIGWFNVGMLYFCTKEEVRTLDQLKKVSLSVGGITSPELGKAFQHAGYTTSDVSNEKILSSLKSSTGCGGLYTIPMYAYAAQYSKYAKYVLNMPICPVMAGFVVNKQVWDSVPEKYKPALLESLRKTEGVFVGVQQKNDADYLQKIADDGGVLTNLTPSEKQAFYDSMADDALRMTKSGEVKVINYAFFKEIEALLKKYRGQ